MFAYQVYSVEYLHLPNGAGAGISQETVLAVDAEAAQSGGIGGRVSDGVQHLHVADVVDVQRFL